MQVYKKKYSEIVALSKLEKKIDDIFVEGNTDKVLIDHFLSVKKTNKKTISIDQIDFSGIKIDETGDLAIQSNKNKLIVLSQLIFNKSSDSPIRCVIDKDFDDYLNSVDNKILLRTDYSCAESYLFCIDVLEKLLNVGIGNFPFKSDFILNQLAGVLRHIFCIRLLRAKFFPSAQLLSIESVTNIEKKTGEIHFNADEYLDKFINKNNLSSDKILIKTNYQMLLSNLKEDPRDNINGHDYFDLLFRYINKIKNTPNFKETNFKKVMMLSVEAQILEQHNLFQLLLT